MQPKVPFSLSGKARETFAKIVEHVLEEECLLSATTRAYRWRVSGPNFHSLHKLFDEQRRQLDGWLVQLFQRSRAEGVGGPDVIEALSRPTEQSAPDAEAIPAPQMLGDLLNRHEELSRKLRENIQKVTDPATAEIVRGLADFHDTTAWMLRMLLEGPDSRQR